MYRNQMSSSEGSLITDRLIAVPIVTSTMNQVSDAYSKTKEYNSLFRLSFAAMEKSLNIATNIAMPIAKPIYHKFDLPLMLLNNMACSQMDTVEKKFPIITKPTDEVLKATMERYNAAMVPVMHYVGAVQSYKDGAVSSMKNFGNETVSMTTARCQTVAKQLNDKVMGNALTKYAIEKLDNTVDILDDCTNKYLPCEGDEEKDAETLKKEHLMRKMVHVSRKLARRLTHRCIQQGTTVTVHVRTTCSQATHKTINLASSTFEMARHATSNSFELACAATNKAIPNCVAPNAHQFLDSLDSYLTNYFQDEILSQKEISKSPAGEDLSGAVFKIFYIGNKTVVCCVNRFKTNLEKSAKYSTQLVAPVTMPITSMASKYVSNGKQVVFEFLREVNMTEQDAAKQSSISSPMTMYGRSVATTRHLRLIGTIWLSTLAGPLAFVTSFYPKATKEASNENAVPKQQNIKSPASANNCYENSTATVQDLESKTNADASYTNYPLLNLAPNNISGEQKDAREQKEKELEVEESSEEEESTDEDKIADNSYSDAYKCNAYSFEFADGGYSNDPYSIPGRK